jgi:Putative Flp pilus-assembly TadE/G-like
MSTKIHTTSFEHRLRSERGASLIHVGLALFMLMGFTVFVLDYGVFWLGRRQAQNAADAGAHAGAVAMLFDDSSDLSATGPAFLNADTIARTSHILGEVGGIHVDLAADTTSWETPAPPVCTANPGTCVQVDVYRDGTHSSTPLPTYFANIWGLTSQDVKATATAQVRDANYSDCLKPWMIPNINPSTGLPFTSANVGTVLVLKEGNPGEAIEPSNFFRVGPADEYEDSITGCMLEAGIGDLLESRPGSGVGPTIHGVEDLIAADPHAVVDGAGVVSGSCAPTCIGYEGKPTSPRIVAIAMFDPAEYVSIGSPSGIFQLHIVNILAFFIQSIGSPPDADVTGVIVGDVGLLKSGPTVGTGESFLRVIQLIR